MTLGLIWAESADGFIGKDGQLPWNLPDEMTHFVETTEGCTIIMGRKTMESLKGPLQGRQNVVVTKGEVPAGFDRVHPDDLGDLLNFLEKSTLGLAWVIGGTALLERAEPHASIMYRSIIEMIADGDVLAPNLHWDLWDQADAEVKDGWTLVFYQRQADVA